ncbi:hypothetical protein F0M18_16980 [Pseudohalioglobus sediminis]|uniref:Uncharacterized protein n=1 Tax=Pseudohalioglobus sediminis TaxID=2606449 RepID=A0A5B0WQ25_9GAMM|nr:hypothetical protein [Pseudohalioglobus sediminis]KAA1188896.1 hypothetical protein F0M18_16980 [Pseudohalioglobus sediminis]
MIIKKSFTHAPLLLVLLSADLALAEHKHPTDQQLRACRDRLAYESKFKHLPMAAFSVNSGTHHHSNVDWTVSWGGRFATGTCKVNKHGGVEKVHTNYDSGPVKESGHHHHHAGKDAGAGGFYYDYHVNRWRDPSGQVCHTCTPENGFPNHGRKQQEWHPQNHLEREASRHLNRSLTEADREALRQLSQ